MSQFKNYNRTQIAQLRDVVQEDIDIFNETGEVTVPLTQNKVSISDFDLSNGSPKLGDKIARNPKDKTDQWLVAEQYFKDNFTEIE